MSRFLNKNVEYFLKIVSSGSFKEASRLLNLSQPALSISIKNFEAEIGVPLFAREKRNAELTLKGRELYDKLLTLEKQITHETNSVLTGTTRPRLRIGSIPWYAERRLLPLMKTGTYEPLDALAQYFIRPAGVLHEAVTRGWLDFAFVNWAKKPQRVKTHPIEEDPAAIGGLKSKFKHIEKAKSYEDLANEKWIYGEGRGANWTDSIAWDEPGFLIADVHALRFLILGGYGIYEFQLAYFSKEEQRRLAFTKFPNRYKENYIYLVWRPDLNGEKKAILEQMIADLAKG